jgi:signal peptidase I
LVHPAAPLIPHRDRWFPHLVIRHFYLLLAFGSLLVLGLLRSEFQLVLVVGQSMEPTLFAGDLLIVRKSAYLDRPPVRGEVVVARYEGDRIVKRVVGMPGEYVDVRRGELYVNGRAEPLIPQVQPGWLNLGRGLLMDDRFALLGDNRSLSAAETVHAIVSSTEILGQVWFAIHVTPWRH